MGYAWSSESPSVRLYERGEASEFPLGKGGKGEKSPFEKGGFRGINSHRLHRASQLIAPIERIIATCLCLIRLICCEWVSHGTSSKFLLSHSKLGATRRKPPALLPSATSSSASFWQNVEMTLADIPTGFKIVTLLQRDFKNSTSPEPHGGEQALPPREMSLSIELFHRLDHVLQLLLCFGMRQEF